MPLGGLCLRRCCCVVTAASLPAQGQHPLHLAAAHLQWLVSHQARLQYGLYQAISKDVASDGQDRSKQSTR